MTLCNSISGNCLISGVHEDEENHKVHSVHFVHVFLVLYKGTLALKIRSDLKYFIMLKSSVGAHLKYT